MTVQQLNTEAISSTGAQFLIDSLSYGGTDGKVPYSKIMDGTPSGSAVAVVKSNGRLKVNVELTANSRLSISGTAQVNITNATLAVTQSGAWNVTQSGTSSVVIGAALPAGTNNIGKVDVSNTVAVALAASIPAGTNSIGAVDVSNTVSVAIVASLPAGTASIGKVDISNTANVVIQNTPSVIASLETGSMYNGTTALTPKYAAFGVNTSGAATIVSTVAAKKIRILSMAVVAEGAAGCYFRDGGSKVMMGDSTELMEFQAGGGMVLPYSPVGWMETSSSSAFQIVPDTATSIAGSVVYVEI